MDNVNPNAVPDRTAQADVERIEGMGIEAEVETPAESVTDGIPAGVPVVPFDQAGNAEPAAVVPATAEIAAVPVVPAAVEPPVVPAPVVKLQMFEIPKPDELRLVEKHVNDLRKILADGQSLMSAFGLAEKLPKFETFMVEAKTALDRFEEILQRLESVEETTRPLVGVDIAQAISDLREKPFDAERLETLERRFNQLIESLQQRGNVLHTGG